jgi:hypothetical protein
MARELTAAEEQQLELLVDVTSVHHVLESLSVICSKKSAHIVDEWNDPALASFWSDAADVIGTLSMNYHIRDISR